MNAAEMYAAGMTRQAIAVALGVSAGTATRILVENGVDLRSRPRAATVAFVWDRAGVARIREMVEAGDSAAKIRRTLSVGHLSLVAGCARFGIPLVLRPAPTHAVRQPVGPRERDRSEPIDERGAMPAGDVIAWGVLRSASPWLGAFSR
jgi:hypothetical protein